MGRPRAVSPWRQDTRVGADRQSARASSPESDGFGHTATAGDPGVCGSALAEGLAPPPRCVPCRRERERPPVVLRAYSRLTVLGGVPRPRPSFGANGPVQARGSGFHVLRQSSAYRMALAWQHRRPSGLAMLHVELALKRRRVAVRGETICRGEVGQGATEWRRDSASRWREQGHRCRDSTWQEQLTSIGDEWIPRDRRIECVVRSSVRKPWPSEKI
jgi:hypothetical protein